jgi:hypothetical protein
VVPDSSVTLIHSSSTYVAPEKNHVTIHAWVYIRLCSDARDDRNRECKCTMCLIQFFGACNAGADYIYVCNRCADDLAQTDLTQTNSFYLYRFVKNMPFNLITNRTHCSQQLPASLPDAATLGRKHFFL